MGGFGTSYLETKAKKEAGRSLRSSFRVWSCRIMCIMISQVLHSMHLGVYLSTFNLKSHMRSKTNNK